MAKNVDLANNPALDPEERQRQLEGKLDSGEETSRTARSNYLVDRNFQYRFATIGVLSLLVFLGVTSLIFYWGLGTVESVPVREQITAVMVDLLPYTGPAVLLLLLLFGVYYLLLSHRFCGPVHRIQQSLQRIRQGEWYFTLSVRSTDYLETVVEEINALLETLRQRERALEQVSDEVASLEQQLDQLKLEEEDTDELSETCESIQDTLRELRTTTGTSPDSPSDAQE